jgi:L-lactate dehydrogenase complex protein LldG
MPMGARDDILDRIRTALADRPRPEPVARDYRTAGRDPASPDQLITRLVDRLMDYRATVDQTTDVRAAIAASLTARTARRVIVPDGFASEWLPPDVEPVRDDPPLPKAGLDAADGVVSTCALAIAETGTIVLDHGPGQGRRALTLLPDFHLVVIRPDQVVAQVPDAIAQLSARPTLTFVSGPSATSDIELNRVEGVHGPRTLHVVIG